MNNGLRLICCGIALVAASACNRHPSSGVPFLDRLTFVRIERDDEDSYGEEYTTARPYNEVVAEASTTFSSSSGWTQSKQGRFVSFTHVPGIKGGLKTSIMVADLTADNSEAKRVTTVLMWEVKKYLS